MSLSFVSQREGDDGGGDDAPTWNKSVILKFHC